MIGICIHNFFRMTGEELYSTVSRREYKSMSVLYCSSEESKKCSLVLENTVFNGAETYGVGMKSETRMKQGC